jgi:hypothetical protein
MPIEGQNRRAQQISRGLAIVLVISAPLVALWLLFGPLRELANHNEGFIAAVGIFVVVPLALLSNKLLENARRKQLAAVATNLLVFELWQNLNYVGQIETSYENNFEWFGTEAPKGVHVPHFGPRLSVLEKFITVEHLASLDERYASGLLEIYAQLCTLRDEFPRWRDSLSSTLESRELYEAFSSTLLSVIDPLMRNMTDLWVRLLSTAAFNPRAPQIAATVTLIRSRILQGQMLHPTYKSSYFMTHPRAFGPQDKIICWRDDWKDAPVEVLQLSSIAPLHESWRPTAPG